MVGYNVQTAGDTESHIIVTHELTDQGFDRGQLSPMAIAAKDVLQRDDFHAIADRQGLSGRHPRERRIWRRYAWQNGK